MKHNPAVEDIKNTRIRFGLTQSEAASLLYVTLRAWQYWESGLRKMPPAYFELFIIKAQNINQVVDRCRKDR